MLHPRSLDRPIRSSVEADEADVLVETGHGGRVFKTGLTRVLSGEFSFFSSSSPFLTLAFPLGNSGTSIRGCGQGPRQGSGGPGHRGGRFCQFRVDPRHCYTVRRGAASDGARLSRAGDAAGEALREYARCVGRAHISAVRCGV